MATKETRIKNLIEYSSLPLDYKIAIAQSRINEAVDLYGVDSCYISFSGGKDSTVLLHIARALYPSLKAVFFDTGLEFPEIRDFVKTIDNVEWIRPSQSFREVIKRYGVPVLSKSIAMAISRYRVAREKGNMVQCDLRLHGGINPTTGKKQQMGRIPKKWHDLAMNGTFKISEQCCRVLKKLPADRYYRKHGGCAIIGTMACESNMRKLDFYNHGCNAFAKEKPQSRPLMFWNEKDIWEYVARHQTPPNWWMGLPRWYIKLYYKLFRRNYLFELNLITYSKIYDMGYKRTGCVFCLFGIMKDKSRFELLKKTHPKLHDYCMYSLGYKEVFEAIGLK